MVINIFGTFDDKRVPFCLSEVFDSTEDSQASMHGVNFNRINSPIHLVKEEIAQST